MDLGYSHNYNEYKHSTGGISDDPLTGKRRPGRPVSKKRRAPMVGKGLWPPSQGGKQPPLEHIPNMQESENVSGGGGKDTPTPQPLGARSSSLLQEAGNALMRSAANLRASPKPFDQLKNAIKSRVSRSESGTPPPDRSQNPATGIALPDDTVPADSNFEL
ncbi:hypothetical protein HDU93_000867, partial [Gonapodya sp. JEL0774]